MGKQEGVRCATTGLLLAAGAMAVASWASPISPGPPASLRDVPHLESGAPNDSDNRLAPVLDAAREVRRAGPGISPALLGIDEGFLEQGNLLHIELREQLPLWSGRPGPNRNFDGGGGSDIFREALSSALRATRDAVFDGGDTANFSLAGIDLSVTLRGDRRGIFVNGYEVAGTDQYAAPEARASRAEERTISHASQEIAVRQYRTDQVSDKITLSDIRKFASDPMTIVGVLAVLGIWVVVAAASSRARGR